MDPGIVYADEQVIVDDVFQGITVAVYNATDRNVQVRIATSWNPAPAERHWNFNACKFRGTPEQLFARADWIQDLARKPVFIKHVLTP